MIIRFSAPLTITHRHDDVDVGADSRPHPHDLVLTVSVAGINFDPATGLVVDPRLGPLSIEGMQRVLATKIDRYNDKALDEILGIKPTVPSLALSIRERYLLHWPNAEVSIRCPDEGWEVQT